MQSVETIRKTIDYWEDELKLRLEYIKEERKKPGEEREDKWMFRDFVNSINVIEVRIRVLKWVLGE